MRMDSGTSPRAARAYCAAARGKKSRRLSRSRPERARGQRQHRGGEREHQFQEDPGNLKAEKQALKDQPLTHKAVGRGQRCNRHGSDEKEGPGPGHAPEQAAILLHIARMRGIQQRPGPQKQQALNMAWLIVW